MSEAPKPKLTVEATARRVLTRVSYNEVAALHHRAAVASEIISVLRDTCAAAEAQGHALRPGSIVAWIDEHLPQLDPATAKPVADLPAEG